MIIETENLTKSFACKKGDDFIGSIGIDAPRPKDSARYSPERIPELTQFVSIHYNTPEAVSQVAPFYASFNDRKNENVSGVLEMKTGEAYKFKRFGTLTDNYAVIVKKNGDAVGIRTAIQDVQYIKMYRETFCDCMGVLYRSGEYEILPDRLILIQSDRNSFRPITNWPTNSNKTVSFVTYEGGNEMLLEVKEKDISSITISPASEEANQRILQMEAEHLALLSPMIEEYKVQSAKWEKEREQETRRLVDEEVQKAIKKVKLINAMKALEEKRIQSANSLNEGDKVCLPSSLTYQHCETQTGKFYCANRKLDATMHGYINRKFSNGFIELRIEGFADISQQQRADYERFGRGKLMMKNRPVENGETIRVDSLTVNKCNVFDFPEL